MSINYYAKNSRCKHKNWGCTKLHDEIRSDNIIENNITSPQIIVSMLRTLGRVFHDNENFQTFHIIHLATYISYIIKCYKLYACIILNVSRCLYIQMYEAHKVHYDSLTLRQ